MAKRNIAAIGREILQRRGEIVARAVRKGATSCASVTFPKSVRLGTGEQGKLDLAEDLGVLTFGLTLSPWGESGRNLCPWEANCGQTCLRDAGQNAMSPARNARLWRTAVYFGARELFLELLRAELSAFSRKVARKDSSRVNGRRWTGAVRLDVLSDLGLALSAGLARDFPELTFYDYTKSYLRARLTNKHPSNYHVAFSYSGPESREHALEVLAAGGRVAMVFDSAPKIKSRREAGPLPENWEGYPVVNGDAHDAIWLHPPGVVLGLRFKASKDRPARVAEAIAAGFVQPVTRLLPMA